MFYAILTFVITGIISYLIFKYIEKRTYVSLEDRMGKMVDKINKAVQKKKDVLKNQHEKRVERIKDRETEYTKNSEESNVLLKRKEGIFSQRKLVSEERVKRLSNMKNKLENNKKDLEKNKDEILNTLLKKSNTNLDEIKKNIFDETDKELEEYRRAMLIKHKDISEQFVEKDCNVAISGILQKYTKKNAQRIHFDPIPIKPVIWEKYRKVFAVIEEISQVELDYNERDKGVYVDHYNLVRRAIAHEALSKIVRRRKFEEIEVKRELKRASAKIHNNMMVVGERAFKILNISRDQFPDELVKLVGRMYYRSSYGQNILDHSIEVAFFSEMLASEIGADNHVAKIAGLFHDIGKAIDQEIDGSHDVLTKQILEEYKIEYPIVHAAWNHHDAIPMETVEARIVQVADALSATRPGARLETGEQYTKKIDMLNLKASEIKEIKKAYVIQAGREVRAIFDSRNINDEKMKVLIKRLAENIEKEGGYPGKIMVHGIRTLEVVEKIKDKKKGKNNGKGSRNRGR